MAINSIQFQKGMSLTRFIVDYGTEAQCKAALVRSRWPDGYRFPACGGNHAYEFIRGTLRYLQCQACRQQTSVISGTLMEHKGKAGCEVDAFKWLNVILGNLKTALSGTHHAFAFRKYAHRYLDEVQYRFNRALISAP